MSKALKNGYYWLKTVHGANCVGRLIAMEDKPNYYSVDLCGYVGFLYALHGGHLGLFKDKDNKYFGPILEVLSFIEPPA